MCDILNKSASQAILEFFRVATKYIGKEIKLKSNQLFSITYNIEDETRPRYQFKYGLPEYGHVFISIIITGEYKGSVDKMLVTAPPKHKELVSIMINEERLLNIGLDTELREHKTFVEIEANINAIKMIELATKDLSEAIILSESKEHFSQSEKVLPAGRAR